MFRFAILLFTSMLSISTLASEQDAAIARAEQLSTGSRYEDAINVLEDVTSGVIGDPSVIKASALAHKYYAAWCDSLRKPMQPPSLVRALARFKAKCPEAAKTYGVDDKLGKTLEEWQTESQKRKDYTALLDASPEIAAAIGDDGKAWRLGIFKTALTDMVSAPGKDNAAFIRTLMDYLKASNNAADALPAEVRTKGTAALMSAGEKLSSATTGLEDALRHYVCAQAVGPAEPDPKLGPLMDKCFIGIAKYYESVHETELAKAWYQAAAAKSANKATIDEAHKAADAIIAQTTQYKAVATLPQELTKATTIKGLPVPYSLNGVMAVKPSGSLIVEKGACIRSGRIYGENTSITLRGTKDAPIVMVDVEIGTMVERAKLTLTAEYVIFVRSPIVHADNMYYGGQHKMTLKNCIFIGPAENIFYDTYVYDICNCTYTDYNLKYCKQFLAPKDIVTGPTAINLIRTNIDPRVIWTISKANFWSCNLLIDEKYSPKLQRVFTQKTAWFDRSSQGLLNWKAYLVPDPGSTGKLELIPPPEKNAACGADWNCLSFQKPE